MMSFEDRHAMYLSVRSPAPASDIVIHEEKIISRVAASSTNRGWLVTERLLDSVSRSHEGIQVKQEKPRCDTPSGQSRHLDVEAFRFLPHRLEQVRIDAEF
jgi:hypothetical protein